MAINGVSSEVPDGRYQRELEREIRDLLNRVRSLESQVSQLKKKSK